MRTIDKFKIPPEISRRVKLTEEQRTEIRSLYQRGGRTWKELALDYGVSPTTIGLIVNPDYAQVQVAQHRQGDYYDKDRQVASNKRYIARKKRLLTEGKLVAEPINNRKERDD